MQEMWVRSLDLADPLKKEMATHSSILVRKIPWTEEPGWLSSMKSQRGGHDWATNTHTFLFELLFICYIKTKVLKNTQNLFNSSCDPHLAIVWSKPSHASLGDQFLNLSNLQFFKVFLNQITTDKQQIPRQCSFYCFSYEVCQITYLS